MKQDAKKTGAPAPIWRVSNYKATTALKATNTGKVSVTVAHYGED
jgi:hypothetical protein